VAVAGQQVELCVARTADVEGDRVYPLRSALGVATGGGASPRAALARFAPDVVHVHNLFPNFGRRWVRSVDVPLVTTLHNYRPLCVNGLLYRDGEVCTLCPDGQRWSGLRYACYRDSRLASLPLTLANLPGPSADPLLTRADRIVVLSELAAEVYAKAGIAPHRMTVWPNFLGADLDPGADEVTGGTDGFLYVGRLPPETALVRLV